MNYLQTEHWLAAVARWWMHSTPFASALPGVQVSKAALPAMDERAPVHLDLAVANRRDVHDERARPDVPLIQ